MSETVKAANAAANFTGEDGNTTVTLEGKFSIRLSTELAAPTTLSELFGKLAVTDFYQAVNVGKTFRGDAPRALATIAIARVVLEGKKTARARAVFSNLGVTLARTAVGDKYVLDELLKGGGSLGGEQSGHIIFPEISLAGDGMITALEVLRVVMERKSGLRALASAYTPFPQVTINAPVSRKPPFDSVPPIREAISMAEKELAGNGRLLARYSGTENLARVMIEGKDEATIRNLAESIARIIREQIG